MSTDTNDIISTLITIAGSDVSLSGATTIEHVVDGRGGVDVHQTDLATDAVVTEVDNTNLPAIRALASDVEHTNLRTFQRVGIVDGTQLPTVHLSRRDVKKG